MRTRNTRKALVGDALARLDLAQQWYNHPGLPGWAWSHVQIALSNDHLGQIGYSLGLDECTSKWPQHKTSDLGPIKTKIPPMATILVGFIIRSDMIY